MEHPPQGSAPEEIKVKQVLEEGEHVGKVVASMERILRQSEVIGFGGNAEVFSPEEGDFSNICFKKIRGEPMFRGNDIMREHEFQRRVLAAGVPTPLSLIVLQEGKREILVMERIKGSSVEDVLHGRAQLPSNFDLGHFFSRLTDMVTKMHNEAGIVHRDLRAANVMVTDEGEPVIIDFGVASDKIGSGTYDDELSYEEAVLQRQPDGSYKPVTGYFENDFKKIDFMKMSVKSHLAKLASRA